MFVGLSLLLGANVFFLALTKRQGHTLSNQKAAWGGSSLMGRRRKLINANTTILNEILTNKM